MAATNCTSTMARNTLSRPAHGTHGEAWTHGMVHAVQGTHGMVLNSFVGALIRSHNYWALMLHYAEGHAYYSSR